MLSAFRVVTRIRTVEIHGILRYFIVQHQHFTFKNQKRPCGRPLPTQSNGQKYTRVKQKKTRGLAILLLAILLKEIPMG